MDGGEEESHRADFVDEGLLALVTVELVHGVCKVADRRFVQLLVLFGRLEPAESKRNQHLIQM